MKKNVIALVLSVVLIFGSICTVPVLASEPIDQEAVTVQTEAGSEEAVEDPADDAAGGPDEASIEEQTEETDEKSEDAAPEETGEKQEEAGEEAMEPEAEESAESGSEENVEGSEEEASEEPASKEGENSSEELNGDVDQAAENSAETETENESQKPVFRGTITTTLPGEGSVVGDTEGKSPEELFSDYVDQSFKGQLSSGRRKAKKSAAAILSGNDKAVYEYIAGQISLVAAGERASTVFEITPEILGLEQTAWTAEDLGVSSIFVDYEDGTYDFSPEALQAVSEKVTIDYWKINDVLLADHPYELYWYDKTEGWDNPYGFGISAYYDEEIEDYVICVTGQLPLRFTVAQEFAAGEYEVDTSIGQSVQSAVANAKAIVSKYRSSSDEDKLRGYMEEICDLVSYNDGAAGGGVNYGNPWQMIWIFDGDPETEVVCEGYSKAFKYLCDQSSFKNDISCILVTGVMSGGTGSGNHMWNIVNMEDGKNYLVDVTNCDDGTIGYPDELFLVGTEETRTDESGREGYYFPIVGITYYYDNGTVGLFSDADLVLCKYNYVPHAVHEWETEYTVDKEATCLEEGVESIHCSVCGAVQEGSERAIPKTSHNYGDWAITKEAACTEAGSREKVCTVCGDKVTETIAAKGHQWETDYTVDKEATCKEEGVESIHCSVCDEIREGSERAIPKTAHNYGNWTTAKEPTCTEAGSREKVCTVCGDKVTETIAAKGHSYGEWATTKEATCTEAGSREKVCADCGDSVTETIAAKGHSYGDWTITKEPTCTEVGSREKACADCGDTVKETIAATGHKWKSDYTVDKEATCKEEGTESIHCSVCDEIQEGSERTIPKTSHSYGDWTTTKEATCTEAGSKEKICADCGAKVTESIVATGHSYGDWTITKEATCTEAGSREKACVDCGDTVKETIDATGHSYGDWTITKEATCTEAGSKEKICADCGDTVKETIAATGHKWKTEYTIDIQPTKTKEGSESIHCSICDAIKEGSQRQISKINKAKQQITAKAAATLEVGKTTKVTVTGAKETPTYNYRSSNNAIATVSPNGTVTGKGVGTVTITVSYSETKNYEAGSTTVRITVKKVLKKPGNCHFAKWNNTKYTSCQIAWKKVDGADGYQTLLSWTNGTHASTTIVKANVLYRNCTVHPQHVSQMKVRAFYMLNGQRVFGPWSNVEYITPSPAKLTTRNTSTGTSLKMNISWNIIYGCNGYNVFLTTNPKGTWYWNQSTSTKADATSAVITQYRGSKLKKNTRYYVRIVTRRKRNGVFCTVPMPSATTNIGSFIIK